MCAYAAVQYSTVAEHNSTGLTFAKEAKVAHGILHQAQEGRDDASIKAVLRAAVNVAAVSGVGPAGAQTEIGVQAARALPTGQLVQRPIDAADVANRVTVALVAAACTVAASAAGRSPLSVRADEQPLPPLALHQQSAVHDEWLEHHKHRQSYRVVHAGSYCGCLRDRTGTEGAQELGPDHQQLEDRPELGVENHSRPPI